MSWYRLAKDYLDEYASQIQSAEKANITNSPDVFQEEEIVPFNLENELDLMRQNKITNPKLLNEIRQPIKLKSSGQGINGLVGANKDLPIYSDNFTKTTDWNTN